MPHRLLDRCFATSFRGLLSPWTHSPCKVRFRGFCLPATSALRVWLPSRRFSPLPGLPALFRADSAYGVSLRSLLLAAGTFPRYREFSPRLPLPQIELDRPKSAQSQPEARLPGTACNRVPCDSCRVFSPTGCRVLPWVSSLPRIVTARLDNGFPLPPPTCLLCTAVACDTSPHLGVSIDKRHARLRESDVPRRVLRLNLPGVQSFAQPGL
jgi:hypothetical protein